MRFSELVKNQEKAVSQVRKEKPLKPPVAPPAPPARSAPALDRLAMEEQIRERLEKELKIKLEKLEVEANRESEQRTQEAQKLLAEKEKAHLREKEELLRKMEAMKSKADQIQEQSKAAEQIQFLEKKLAERTEELNQKERMLREESEARIQKLIGDFQQRLKEKEAELQHKDQAVARRVPDKAALPPEPVAAVPRPVEAPLPSRTLPKAAEFFAPALDPVMEKKLRTIYDDLLSASMQVFQQIEKAKEVHLDGLDKPLSAMVEMVRQNDSDLALLILEPYPDVNYFPFHAVNCSILATVLGLDFNLSPADLKELGLAALLHDIGLVTLQENLDYPKQLTPQMQGHIFKHPDHGAELLEGKVSETVLTAVRQHHETDNGKGYPSGLQAADLQLYSKIIQIVDSFEAMTHIRPYRKRPLEVTAAVKDMIEKGKGVYDRAVLKSLMGRVGLYPIRSLVELSNKQIARVVKQNRLFPMSPLVKIEFDEEGNKVKESPVLDLTQNQLVHIIGPIGGGAVTSYQKDKIEQERKVEAHSASMPPFPFQEIIPFVLIVLVLILLIYVVFKI